MGDHVALEAALVVEVEVLEALAGRETRGADAVLAAVVLAGGDLALKAGGQELLVAPALGPGPLSEAFDRRRQRWRLQRPATPTRRAISLIDRPSARCSRRISAQSSTLSTSFLPGRESGQGPLIHTISGGPGGRGVKTRPAIRGQYSAVTDIQGAGDTDGIRADPS